MQETPQQAAAALLPFVTAQASGGTIQFNDSFDPSDPNYEPSWRDLKFGIRPGMDVRALRVKPLEPFPFPEGYTAHNPDNVTAEQVGEGFRLLCTLEVDADAFNEEGWYWWKGGWMQRQMGYQASERPTGAWCTEWQSVRIPATTPFPEPPKPTKTVPLEREDVPLGSWIRRKDFLPEDRVELLVVGRGTIAAYQNGSAVGILYKTLREQWEISRDDGQTWQPCEKEVPSD